MQHAVIVVAGKQYLVQAGTKLTTDHVAGKAGETVEFPKLLSFDESAQQIGTPKLTGTAKGKIVSQGLGDKVMVVKFKRKVRYRRKSGYRTPQTVLEITAV
ncbi:MAG: 50S ribosomal protein L21 [Patescibacteria group bacterium]|nr:50S ribosomal protein L21 [Patescibacteria group bacterium]